MEQYFLVLTYDVTSRVRIRLSEEFIERINALRQDSSLEVSSAEMDKILNSLQVTLSQDAIQTLENLGFTRCSDCECTVRNTWVRLFDPNNLDHLNLIDDGLNEITISSITNAWRRVLQVRLESFINGLFLTVINNPEANALFVTCRTNANAGEQNWQTMTHETLRNL